MRNKEKEWEAGEIGEEGAIMAWHYEILTSDGELLEQDDGSVNYASATQAQAAAANRAEQLKSEGNIPGDGNYQIEVSES